MMRQCRGTKCLGETSLFPEKMTSHSGLAKTVPTKLDPQKSYLYSRASFLPEYGQCSF